MKPYEIAELEGFLKCNGWNSEKQNAYEFLTEVFKNEARLTKTIKKAYMSSRLKD